MLSQNEIAKDGRHRILLVFSLISLQVSLRSATLRQHLPAYASSLADILYCLETTALGGRKLHSSTSDPQSLVLYFCLYQPQLISATSLTAFNVRLGTTSMPAQEAYLTASNDNLSDWPS
ncbi:uncharacterized protein MYCFIDRAFT_174336 [Pseudocercospora fijiensis CIRAD86]|uniref:Uncharacterized protein n=1 Tax=Pseudocercospora fijiensis (strain CIRAD86) TaxID=383855 RepID=M3B054_PSEFD|nr:uncharacterized protein MYCFIDRAFT_174336 [Pseudocercospora fijiensis CIRAD86]EME82797.1 hypothetical protein MYCFIDRAFT_174336 [Pseudocercospora fijiensis CIRAD86]